MNELARILCEQAKRHRALLIKRRASIEIIGFLDQNIKELEAFVDSGIEPLEIAEIMATENCSMQDCSDAAECIRDLYAEVQLLRKLIRES